MVSAISRHCQFIERCIKRLSKYRAVSVALMPRPPHFLSVSISSLYCNFFSSLTPAPPSCCVAVPSALLVPNISKYKLHLHTCLPDAKQEDKTNISPLRVLFSWSNFSLVSFRRWGLEPPEVGSLDYRTPPNHYSVVCSNIDTLFTYNQLPMPI